MTPFHFSLFIPEILSVVFLAYFVIRSAWAGKKDCPSIFNEMTVCSLLLLASLFIFGRKTGIGFQNMASADSFAFYFKVLFTSVFAVVAMMSREFLKNAPSEKQSFGLILWCGLVGLYFVSSSVNLLALYVSTEILAMSLYVLAANGKNTPHGSAVEGKSCPGIEAGLKYFILGTVASAFMVFGTAMIYLKTGSLSLVEIAAAEPTVWQTPSGTLALLFFFAGIGFKIAVFPFHLWVPDVYEGSPTPATALMSVASKAVGILILIRFFQMTVMPANEKWHAVLAWFSVLTLLYGSLGALGQTKVKRLLGYSSITHSGYLMLAFAAENQMATASMLYYLLGYAASTLGLFYALTLIEKQYHSDRTENLNGLSKTSPFLAWSLFIYLFSIAGIPPLAGFMGKFWILSFTLQAGLILPAAIGLLAVVLGMAYYLPLAIRIVFKEPERNEAFQVPLSAKIILGLLSLLSIAIGLFQAPLIQAAVIAIKN